MKVQCSTTRIKQLLNTKKHLHKYAQLFFEPFVFTISLSHPPTHTHTLSLSLSSHLPLAASAPLTPHQRPSLPKLTVKVFLQFSELEGDTVPLKLHVIQRRCRKQYTDRDRERGFTDTCTCTHGLAANVASSHVRQTDRDTRCSPSSPSSVFISLSLSLLKLRDTRLS